MSLDAALDESLTVGATLAHVAGFETPAGEWTATPPDKPGWYWWRDGRGNDWVPARVYDDGLASIACGWPRRLPVIGGQWWSVPIQEPPA